MERKKAVGYIRSLTNKESGYIQQTMIEEFCKNNMLNCINIYADYQKRNNRRPDEMERAVMIGLRPNRWTRVYEQWEHMLVDIIHREDVDYILVDTYYRLYTSVEVKNAFNNVCRMNNVKVIEVGENLPPAFNRQPEKVLGIYLSTNESKVRTRPVINNIDSVYAYVYEKYNDWQINLFLEQKEGNKKVLHKMKDNLDRLNLVLIRRVQHVTRHTFGFVQMIGFFQRNGVEVESIPYGKIRVIQESDLLKQKLKVAVYQCADDYSSKVTEDKCKVFVECRTSGWDIKEVYIDSKSNRCDRPNLCKLLSESNKYDVILVDEFNHITDDSKLFMDFLQKVGLPVFSIREGEMVYEGKN